IARAFPTCTSRACAASRSPSPRSTRAISTTRRSSRSWPTRTTRAGSSRNSTPGRIPKQAPRAACLSSRRPSPEPEAWPCGRGPQAGSLPNHRTRHVTGRLRHPRRTTHDKTKSLRRDLGPGAARRHGLDAGSRNRSGRGARGEKAAPSADVALTADELAKVKAKHATAALVFHYGGNDWSNAQEAALKAQFAAEGINVIAVTDAGFKPEKQVSDLETVLAKKPDIIVSIPVDPVATAAAYKAAADKGVKLV